MNPLEDPLTVCKEGSREVGLVAKENSLNNPVICVNLRIPSQAIPGFNLDKGTGFLKEPKGTLEHLTSGNHKPVFSKSQDSQSGGGTEFCKSEVLPQSSLYNPDTIQLRRHGEFYILRRSEENNSPIQSSPHRNRSLWRRKSKLGIHTAVLVHLVYTPRRLMPNLVVEHPESQGITISHSVVAASVQHYW